MPDSVFAVAAGVSRTFYPASAALSARREPGFRFELCAGRPWQWAGAGDRLEVSLTDVLAAVNTARLMKLPGHVGIDLAAVHAAHQRAASEAVADGDALLAARLLAEQADVSAAGLVGEEQAAQLLGITGRSLNNLRLATRAICPPVLIAGNLRTKWFWAPAQFADWQADRPGKGWRLGRSGDEAAAAATGAT